MNFYESNIIEIFAVLLFFISLYGMMRGRNAIKSIVFIILMETAVIMFFLSIGFTSGIVPPIGTGLGYAANVADPLPQALMITAIIIGLSLTAVNVTMLITLCRELKTIDWDTIRAKSMED